MGVPVQLIAGILIFLAVVSAPAAAQTLAGAAFQRDVQRFSGDPDLNRLNGSADAPLVTAGIQFPARLTARIEISRTAAITNTDAFSAAIDEHSVVIASTLAHRLRTISAFAGYTQPVTARIRVTYLAGVAFAHAERTFTTNAPDLLLVPPSAPPDAAAVRTVDEFTVLTIGADVLATLHGPLALLAGVRVLPLSFAPDLSGVSVRPFVGAAWVF